MMTPVNEFKEYFFNTFDGTIEQASWIAQTIIFLKQLEVKEKELLNEAFNYGSNTSIKFKDYFKQFKSL